MRLRGLYIVVALASLVFYSCEKEYSYEGGTLLTPPDSIPVVSSADTMLATVNGSGWVAQTISASAFSGQIEITGSSLTGPPAVSLTMASTASPGAPYAFGSTGSPYTGIYLPTTTGFLQSTSGQLTILENDSVTRRVRGNFQFLATDPTGQTADSAELTLGYFSVQHNP